MKSYKLFTKAIGGHIAAGHQLIKGESLLEVAKRYTEENLAHSAITLVEDPIACTGVDYQAIYWLTQQSGLSNMALHVRNMDHIWDW